MDKDVEMTAASETVDEEAQPILPNLSSQCLHHKLKEAERCIQDGGIGTAWIILQAILAASPHAHRYWHARAYLLLSGIHEAEAADSETEVLAHNELCYAYENACLAQKVPTSDMLMRLLDALGKRIVEKMRSAASSLSEALAETKLGQYEPRSGSLSAHQCAMTLLCYHRVACRYGLYGFDDDDWPVAPIQTIALCRSFEEWSKEPASPSSSDAPSYLSTTYARSAASRYDITDNHGVDLLELRREERRDILKARYQREAARDVEAHPIDVLEVTGAETTQADDQYEQLRRELQDARAQAEQAEQRSSHFALLYEQEKRFRAEIETGDKELLEERQEYIAAGRANRDVENITKSLRRSSIGLPTPPSSGQVKRRDSGPETTGDVVASANKLASRPEAVQKSATVAPLRTSRKKRELADESLQVEWAAEPGVRRPSSSTRNWPNPVPLFKPSTASPTIDRSTTRLPEPSKSSAPLAVPPTAFNTADVEMRDSRLRSGSSTSSTRTEPAEQPVAISESSALLSNRSPTRTISKVSAVDDDQRVSQRPRLADGKAAAALRRVAERRIVSAPAAGPSSQI